MSSSASSDGSGPLVLVTGATGYIAGHIVSQLLSAGYSVRGTVRSLHDSKAVALQKDFPALQLYQADLLQDGSFDAATAGVRFLFHTASPATLTAGADPQKAFIDPAVKGTSNVVSSGLRSASVEKIVVTSSVLAVLDPTRPAHFRYTEADWATHWQLDKTPYQLSKVLAERRAYELVEQHNAAHPERAVKLVSILPSTVTGPPVGSRVDGFSVSSIISLLDGSQLSSGISPARHGTTVDVREVAAAHVAAITKAEASGRYLVSHEQSGTQLEFIDILRERLPGRPLPDQLVNWRWTTPYNIDNTRGIQELGIHYRSVRDSIRDMVDRLLELGLITA